MPRKAQQKHEQAIYHIMSRSETEFLLFRDDEDKEYYLSLLKRYTDKYIVYRQYGTLVSEAIQIWQKPQRYSLQ